MSHLKTITLPEFGQASACPLISTATYEARLALACRAMAQEHLDLLVVYGDREHAANLCYLTGFDPRFEEALLLLDRAGARRLVVGNECMGYLPDPGLRIPAALFQAFSLMGQPRGDSRPLREILADFGLRAGMRVGCVGWKRYGAPLVPAGECAIDLPAYIVDTLREQTADPRRVVNATHLFTHPEQGLRAANEPEQIAAFEYAATVTSGSILAGLRALRPGVREQDIEACFRTGGLPLSCHSMTSFGAKAARGLASPGDQQARRGDFFTMAQGVWGSLTARAGALAAGPADLPPETGRFYAAFVANYFDAVAAWYSALRIGATGGEVFRAVASRIDSRLLKLALNPGHTIHLDEWVDSPFFQDSALVLRSGVALQADLIPVSQGPFCCANVEDGVVLADAELRAALSQRDPDLWQRVQARRAFMSGTLGIPLDPAVLPLGNAPGYLPPYALDLNQAMAM
jgi:hypothetical protein